MKKFASIFAALAVLTGRVMPSPAQSVNPLLITPGKSIGKLALGPNGLQTLKRLGEPAIRDAGMSQTRQVWVSKGNRNTTLYIHTIANGAIQAKPEKGVSIDVAHTSSGNFHTASGIAVGSALTQVQRAFPRARRDQEFKEAIIYSDPGKGIAFEFASDRGSARCIGITIFIPGDRKIIRSEEVSNLIKNNQPL